MCILTSSGSLDRSLSLSRCPSVSVIQYFCCFAPNCISISSFSLSLWTSLPPSLSDKTHCFPSPVTATLANMIYGYIYWPGCPDASRPVGWREGTDQMTRTPNGKGRWRRRGEAYGLYTNGMWDRLFVSVCCSTGEMFDTAEKELITGK